MARRGFGISLLGLKGIEVVSTKPPGRDGDPYADELKALEERLKANNKRSR